MLQKKSALLMAWISRPPKPGRLKKFSIKIDPVIKKGTCKTKTVIIGPDRPFTIIGERINPTGRKLLAKEMAEGDFSRVESGWNGKRIA